MDEKQKLYMFQDLTNQQFFAIDHDEVILDVVPNYIKYFTSDGLSRKIKYYKSLKSLAVAIRNAGYHGVDKTKPV